MDISPRAMPPIASNGTSRLTPTTRTRTGVAHALASAQAADAARRAEGDPTIMPTAAKRAAAVAALLTIAVLAPAARAVDRCGTGAFVLSDAKDMAGVRAAIERACPCATATSHSSYLLCARTVIDDASDGTPVLGAYSLRRACKVEARKIVRSATCGSLA